MIRALRRSAIRGSVAVVLGLAARLARAGRTGALESAGRAVARWRGIEPARDARAIAEAWQRAFPSPKEIPIVEVDEATSTAYAEIRTPCPLRGSGELETCHRMMAYDRAFAERAGGRFVVLRSQAEPGVTVCQVALRPLDVPADDLVPAHRARDPRRAGS